MACEIAGNILTLSVDMRSGFLSDGCAVLPGVTAMGVYVFNAHRHGVPEMQRCTNFVWAKLPENDSSVSDIELYPVRVDA